MPLFGPVHLAWLAGIAGAAILSIELSRRGEAGASSRAIRLALGFGLAVNELIWWGFRYSHEGIHGWNLPFQLCDVTVWASVLACLRPSPVLAEFTYFAGMAGAGMALLTPDLWSPWPSYPAVYFFLAHGGVVIAAAMMGFAGVARFTRHAPWTAFGLLLGYAAMAGALDGLLGANYMYLSRKPKSASLLSAFGPWPFYIAAGAAVALAFFWLLWLPARGARRPAN